MRTFTKASTFVLILILGFIYCAMPVAAASGDVFPEDLLSSAEICGQYFTHADEPGTVYEEIDGEYIMTIPQHKALNFLYTKEAIPYESFTVSFDFYLNITPDSHFHEMDFLFGMTGGAKPFHQASIVANQESLFLKHYTYTGEWTQYKEDEYFYNIYDTEYWQTFMAEVTPEGVTIYLNDEELGTLTDTENCTGASGYIGLRGGSAGGWKIKNLVVTEGVGGVSDETPTEGPTMVPTEEPTVAPTEEPPVVPTQAPTQEPVSDEEAGFPWFAVGITVAVIAVVAVGIILVVIKKKAKKNTV